MDDLHARRSGGEHAERIVKPPLIMPEAPIPAIARPTINIVELTASAQIRDPRLKNAKKLRKTHLEVFVSSS